MSFLASAILLVCIAHCFCNTRSCTRDERCLLVDASVCDNSKCLFVTEADIDKIAKNGLKSYAFNTGREAFFSFCGMSYKYEQPGGCNGNSTINIIFTLYSGPSCNESTTIVSPLTADPDPKEAGQMRLFTSDFNGDKYEECYIYLEPEKAFVYRKCLIDSSLPPGKACASLFAKMASTENCPSPGLEDFVKNLNINLFQKTVDCL